MNAAVEAMIHNDGATTAPLDEFLADYAEDDNLWWRIASGHHMNLFDAAVDERQTERALADDLYDKLAGTRVHVPPSKLNGIDGALARYREARGR